MLMKISNPLTPFGLFMTLAIIVLIIATVLAYLSPTSEWQEVWRCSEWNNPENPDTDLIFGTETVTRSQMLAYVADLPKSRHFREHYDIDIAIVSFIKSDGGLEPLRVFRDCIEKTKVKVKA